MDYGFSDTSDLWQSGYDMPKEDFVKYVISTVNLECKRRHKTTIQDRHNTQLLTTKMPLRFTTWGVHVIEIVTTTTIMLIIIPICVYTKVNFLKMFPYFVIQMTLFSVSFSFSNSNRFIVTRHVDQQQLLPILNNYYPIWTTTTHFYQLLPSLIGHQHHIFVGWHRTYIRRCKRSLLK